MSNQNPKDKANDYYFRGILCEMLIPNKHWIKKYYLADYTFLFEWAIANYEKAIALDSDWKTDSLIRKLALEDYKSETKLLFQELIKLLEINKRDKNITKHLALLYLICRYNSESIYHLNKPEYYEGMDKIIFGKRHKIDYKGYVNKYLNINPGDHTALIFKAKLFYNNNEIYKSIAVLDKILRVNPEDISALTLKLKTCSHHLIENNELSTQISNRLIKKYPNSPESYYSRLYYYRESSEYEFMIDDVTKIFSMVDENILLLQDRGNGYYRLSKYKLAFNDFSAAYKIAKEQNVINRMLFLNYDQFAISAVMSGEYKVAGEIIKNILNTKSLSPDEVMKKKHKIFYNIARKTKNKKMLTIDLLLDEAGNDESVKHYDDQTKALCHFLLAQIYKRTNAGNIDSELNKAKYYYPAIYQNEQRIKLKYPMFYDSKNGIINSEQDKLGYERTEKSYRYLIADIIKGFGDKVKKKETMKGNYKNKIIEELRKHGVSMEENTLRSYLSKLGFTKGRNNIEK